MLKLPMVVAGEYEDERPLGVFANEADAQEFCRLYNDERGHGINDGERARVEPVPGFPAGDPGVSGHEVEVRYINHQFNQCWSWSCRCGQYGSSGHELGAREQAAQHIAHWSADNRHPALPD